MELKESLLACLSILVMVVSTSEALLLSHGSSTSSRRTPMCSVHTLSYPKNIRPYSSRCWEKPKWLEDAMGGDEQQKEPITEVPTLTPGLAGFCLDDELGFVAILSSDGKYLATTITLQDRGSDRLVSPEALTMVQLAGGMDLGMAMLPPDALAQMVVSELVDEDDDGGSPFDKGHLPVVSLNGIRAVPNEDYVTDDTHERETTTPRNADQTLNSDVLNDKARNQAIQQGLPQVCKAIQKLAGLQKVTGEQVEAAMKVYANQEGALDREGFSKMLDKLRRGSSNFVSSREKKVKFVLDVTVVRQDLIQDLTIDTLDTFRALGLSMRHKLKIQVHPECLEHDNGTILVQFPKFRTMEELYEDAKRMEDIIPSMFKQQDRPPLSDSS
eukprot:scaffold3505_cov98-Cylindrotheca_fusiformis.AAC.5